MNAKQDYLQSAPTELIAVQRQHSQTEHASNSFAQFLWRAKGTKKMLKRSYHEIIDLLNILNKKQEKNIFGVIFELLSLWLWFVSTCTFWPRRLIFLFLEGAFLCCSSKASAGMWIMSHLVLTCDAKHNKNNNPVWFPGATGTQKLYRVQTCAHLPSFHPMHVVIIISGGAIVWSQTERCYTPDFWVKFRKCC